MADHDGQIAWYDCDPRAIFPMDESFHVPRRLDRTIGSGKYEVRYDTAFHRVMELCAEPGPGRETTWISQQIIDAFVGLHELGFAHSAEAWQGEQLVGGLYGIAIRGLFAGESMFHRARDAGKVALVTLIRNLRQHGYVLFDVQYIVNDNFKQFGIMEISKKEYHQRLAQALEVQPDIFNIEANSLTP